MSGVPKKYDFNRPMWELRYERAPSLCRHYTPSFGGHRDSVSCFCKPFIQNELNYTVVIHEDRNMGDWKTGAT